MRNHVGVGLSLLLFLSLSQDLHGSVSDSAFKLLIKSGLFFSQETIFRISYTEGYNLNFEITEDTARSLLPDNIRPLKLKIMETDDSEKYYLSWYVAGMQGEDNIKRIDLFTYGVDQNNERTLYFVSSVMELPEQFKNNVLSSTVFKKALDYMARDTQTGKPSYPHFYTDKLKVTRDILRLQLENAVVETLSCPALASNGRFSKDFVMANSQIYRNSHDKNVNFFNQSFIDAPVESRNPQCISMENIELFHPMLKQDALKSVQFYGSPKKQIRWYFEM